MNLNTEKRIIGLIPARSGSKGIINKNLKKIEKLSLVEKAVKNLKSSKKIKDVFVSSDSQKILSKISKFGGIPFKRLKKFATDRTTGNDVIKNFISKKKIKNKYNSCLPSTNISFEE